jgi:hypothetical protein
MEQRPNQDKNATNAAHPTWYIRKDALFAMIAVLQNVDRI